MGLKRGQQSLGEKKKSMQDADEQRDIPLRQTSAKDAAALICCHKK